MRLEDFAAFDLRLLVDKIRHQGVALLGQTEAFADFAFDERNDIVAQGFLRDRNSKRNRSSRFLLPESPQILQKVKAVLLPGESVFMDDDTLRAPLFPQGTVHLVKQGEFNGERRPLRLGMPETVQERGRRVPTGKHHGLLWIKRIRLGRKQEGTAPVANGAATAKATVLRLDLGKNLGAHLRDIELATGNHLVERLHVGKVDVPFEGGFFETRNEVLVDLGVVRTGGNSEGEVHRRRGM